VTRAVVGIGAWAPELSTLYDAVPPTERRSLARLGVRAEVSGALLDAAGRFLEAELSERLIAPTAAQLAALPEVIAIAYGTAKASAVRAALHSGVVSGIVTHSALAEALLRDAPQPSPATG
jgi:DNA-binding transcriptional regulator LsrR (DeoR family)